jgi:hypothetical protein
MEQGMQRERRNTVGADSLCTNQSIQSYVHELMCYNKKNNCYTGSTRQTHGRSDVRNHIPRTPVSLPSLAACFTNKVLRLLEIRDIVTFLLWQPQKSPPQPPGLPTYIAVWVAQARAS